MTDENKPDEALEDFESELDELESALDEDPTVTKEPEESTDYVEPPEEPENDTPEPEQASDPDAAPEAEDDPEAETRADSDFKTTMHEAAVARNARITQAVSEMGETPEPVVDERREELEARLQECADVLEKLEASVDEVKAEARDIVNKLHPQNIKSDRHVDAVRGYLKASAEDRANRGMHPARLKEMLTKAGMAPIDAAFQRARARGMTRPTRSVAKGDQQSGAQE